MEHTFRWWLCFVLKCNVSNPASNTKMRFENLIIATKNNIKRANNTSAVIIGKTIENNIEICEEK